MLMNTKLSSNPNSKCIDILESISRASSDVGPICVFFIIKFKAKSKRLDHLNICIRSISLALRQQRGHASLQSAINELTAGGRR